MGFYEDENISILILRLNHEIDNWIKFTTLALSNQSHNEIYRSKARKSVHRSAG